MRAYEEWVSGPASKDWIRDEFDGAEDGWEAALKWLYRRIEKRHTRQDIEDMILKELGDDSV